MSKVLVFVTAKCKDKRGSDNFVVSRSADWVPTVRGLLLPTIVAINRTKNISADLFVWSATVSRGGKE